ncbi:hypothetical protein ACIQ4I_12605 [Rummeliibacillus sp. NPDC094406]|uniref:hypothetical protein n=1 Tax=Rummeliibacillus sp. NPDC094406 TaxID=3364511 RepID=UPI003810626F
MKHVYAFESKSEYDQYDKIIQKFKKKLIEYEQILKRDFSLDDSPNAVVWTSSQLATETFSTIPLPAYTSKNVIYMSPDIEEWRKLFIRQLDNKNVHKIRQFYESYSEVHLFVILAHELTHHLDLFIDDFDDEWTNSIWFEEGMCFYLPRKLLLNEADFQQILQVEKELIQEFSSEYGHHSLDDFGIESYTESLSSIMFDYWRSFIQIYELVERRYNHNILELFNDYHHWHNQGRKIPLTQFFSM